MSREMPKVTNKAETYRSPLLWRIDTTLKQRGGYDERSKTSCARDSEQRPQSILSLAERSDPKVMGMHKELSVKSRVRGDFHARFCERVRVKLPRSTRPMTQDSGTELLANTSKWLYYSRNEGRSWVRR